MRIQKNIKIMKKLTETNRVRNQLNKIKNNTKAITSLNRNKFSRAKINQHNNKQLHRGRQIIKKNKDNNSSMMPKDNKNRQGLLVNFKKEIKNLNNHLKNLMFQQIFLFT